MVTFPFRFLYCDESTKPGAHPLARFDRDMSADRPAGGYLRECTEVFFFEKKNQKTFDYLQLPHREFGYYIVKNQKFFASFFKKRRSCFIT